MKIINKQILRIVFFFIAFNSFQFTYAAVIHFNGELGFIFEDTGGIYSGSALGTAFSGEIDDVSYDGFITDGTTQTNFSMLIAAGGIEIENDRVLTDDDIAVFNALGITQFAAGNLVDTLNIEGDEQTAGDGH